MSNTGTLVYAVDDDASAREGVAGPVRSAGLRTKAFASGEEFPVKRFLSNNQISWLRRGCYLPSQESAICLFVGLCNNGVRWTICSSRRTISKLELTLVGLHGEKRIPMGYHSEPKTPEEIREIFREVQAAKVTRAESFDKASRLDPELRLLISPIAPFTLWTERYSDEAQAA